MLYKHCFGKAVLSFVLFFCSVSAFAQNQAIKTLKLDDGSASSAYNSDALVDMQSNKRGLLLPRVALSATNSFAPLSAFTAGMAVFNTATAGSGATAVSPGYYYCDGSKWVRMADASTGWLLGGNSNGVIKAIGTNDVYDFPLVTAGTEALRVNTSQQLLIGTTSVPTGGTTAKLIINNGTTNGAIQIKDGTEGSGRVLTSDANGVGTWINNVAITPVVYGHLNATNKNINPISYLGSSITVGTGKWLIYIGEMVSQDATAANSSNIEWIRLTLSSSSSSISTTGFSFLASNLVSGYQSLMPVPSYAFLSGVIPINNTSGNILTLYLWSSLFTTYGTPPPSTIGNNGENYLFAVPSN